MKANEFVRKFGLDEAKRIIRDKEIKGRYRHLNVCHVDLVELYEIVESHELVKSFGGLKRAKRILKKSYTQFNTMVSVVWNDNPSQCNIENLEQAIADVESTQ